jgi:signal transduction histidine kinase
MEVDGKIKKAPLDPDGIHTCLTNLVSNAIDACLMAETKGTEVLIKVAEVGGKLVFSVSDNGSGIDYEIKKKIFTTFFTTKGGAGTGLGLLTTRKIVQEHGGKIMVESEKGEGARFRMEFPRKRLMALYRSQ